MLKSKFIDVLRTFKPEELKKFRLFVISPFHNKNRNAVKLFDLIRKFYPEFSSPLLEKEKLFKKLYPGKKYSDIVMRILLSDLLKLSEEFLAYNSFISSGFNEDKFLLGELQNRKLDTLFTKHLRELEEKLGKEGIIDSGYFYDKFQMESAKVNFLISRDRQNESGQSLLKQSEYLLDFFLFNSLNIIQELNEQEEVLNEKFKPNLARDFFGKLDLKEFMKLYRSSEHKYSRIIEISYLMYQVSAESGGYEVYDKLFSLVKENVEKFTDTEQFNLVLGLESCCLAEIQTGGALSHERLMEVYEFMLSSGVLSTEGRSMIQANLYRNIFYTAVVLKRYEWAEEFAEKYKEKLLPEQQEDMLNYTKALLNFERENYEAALQYISKVNYRFFVFKYEAKVLMLKLYYELKAYEQALSLIDSFTHFLMKNRKVPEFYKESFMTFLKYVKALIKLTHSPGKEKEIETEITLSKAEGEIQLINKRWIMKKIEEAGF
jgi:hypothetical protein